MQKKIRIISLFLMCFILLISVPVHAKTKRLTLYIGETYKVSSSKRWKSNRKKIASVNAGVIKAKTTGKATIKTKGKKIFITVKKPEITGQNNITKLELAQLTLKCNAQEKVIWKSSKPNIVMLCGQNKSSVYIYGKKEGTAIITAKYKKKTYRFKVTVSPLQMTETQKKEILSLHPLYGKKIAIYGSSNDTGKHTNNKGWVNYIQDKLSGIAKVINKSVGGNTVVKSVERLLSDPNLSTYDIIVISTVRNSYRGNLKLPDGKDRGFLESMYTLYNAINKNKQTVYFASCMPYTNNFRSLSNTMAVYDGLVYRTCQKLGFHYMDMHSFVDIKDADSDLYTYDGAHFKSDVIQKLGEACLTSISNGGNTLKPYVTKVSDTELLKYIKLNQEYVEVSPFYMNYNYYSIDTDFNVNLYLWLIAKKDIPVGSNILLGKSDIHFYPENTYLSSNSPWGAFYMFTDGHTTNEKQISAGTTFLVQINAKAMMFSD